jgi:hypothetical protein
MDASRTHIVWPVDRHQHWCPKARVVPVVAYRMRWRLVRASGIDRTDRSTKQEGFEVLGNHAIQDGILPLAGPDQ